MTLLVTTDALAIYKGPTAIFYNDLPSTPINTLPTTMELHEQDPQDYHKWYLQEQPQVWDLDWQMEVDSMLGGIDATAVGSLSDLSCDDILADSYDNIFGGRARAPNFRNGDLGLQSNQTFVGSGTQNSDQTSIRSTEHVTDFCYPDAQQDIEGTTWCSVFPTDPLEQEQESHQRPCTSSSRSKVPSLVWPPLVEQPPRCKHYDQTDEAHK